MEEVQKSGIILIMEIKSGTQILMIMIWGGKEMGILNSGLQ
jgi:hypothetical protein